MPDFLSRLHQEIDALSDQQCRIPPDTLYFGGGTPSLIPLDDLESLMRKLEERFDLSELTEVTLEVNPDDITPEKLQRWLNLGINRLSIGVQSFDEELLKFMNRAHDRQTALNALNKVRSAGYSNFSVDLIYGNPGQSPEMLNEDLNQFLQFDPPHISAYALTIEPRTRLGKLEELGRLDHPEDDMVIQHADLVENQLIKSGYNRYEISNYGKPGYEAVHNSNYWNHSPYLGLGPGAHGYWWDDKNRIGIRTVRKPDLKSYLTRPFSETLETEELNLRTLAEERIMTAIRTSKGVDLHELNSAYEYQLTDKQKLTISVFEEQKWISSENPLILTREGRNRVDRITLELISAG